MKLMKKLIIAAALMCSAMFLVACGGGEVEYKVTVKDALGNTYGKDTIVEFYNGEEKVKDVAEDFLKFEEENIEKLKNFL